MHVTKEEVFQLAEQFKEEDKKITVAALRASLGDRGSFTTISNHLRAWKKEERERANEVSDEEIPDTIRDVASHMVRAVWRSASEWAEREIAAIKKVCVEQTKEAEDEVKEAFQEVEALQEKYDYLTHELQAVTAARNDLEKQAIAREQKSDHLQIEVETIKSRCADLERSVNELSERVTQETARAATAEAELRRVEEDLERERERSKELAEKLTNEAREAAKYREKVEQLLGKAKR